MLHVQFKLKKIADLIKSGLKINGYNALQQGEASRHHTYIFNVFIMMTISSLLISKNTIGSRTVLKYSRLYLIIISSIFVIQFILVTFGGFVLGVAPGVIIFIYLFLRVLDFLGGLFALLLGYLILFWDM